jgi:hypothetical protein
MLAKVSDSSDLHKHQQLSPCTAQQPAAPRTKVQLDTARTIHSLSIESNGQGNTLVFAGYIWHCWLQWHISDIP